MSGKIKTGASTWSTVSELKVKTSSSNWATVSKAFVKTASGVWSQWFIAPIRDSFSRTVSGKLNNADTGQLWETISGTWFANGSQAQANDIATAYPSARIDYGDVNATVSLSPSPGTGPAVWMTTSNDWYAAVLYEDQVDGTYPCNCVCNGHSECSPNPCYGYGCPPCSTTSGTTTSTYPATQQANGGYWQYGFTASGPYYSCSSGNVSGSLCYECGNYPWVIWTGSNCKSIYGEYYQSAQYVGPATRSYTCPAGYETGHSNINSCYYWVTTYTYVCNSGDGSPSGTTCYHTEPTSTCNSPCVTGYGCGCTPYHVSGGTYPNCDGYGSTCSSCGTQITRYFLRIIKSVNGVVTTVATDISLSEAPTKIKLEASNGILTYSAYSDAAMTTLMGSGTHTPSNPITSTYHGIVKSPSAYAQGSTVDNFSVSG